SASRRIVIHRPYLLCGLPCGCQPFLVPMPALTYRALRVPKIRAVMSTKITKRTVDQLSLCSRNLLLLDCDIKVFGVRCRTSGAKYYFVKMRIGRRQRWITIGRHGSPWTPETARRDALRLLGVKAAGQDPARERDRHKGAITIAELGSRFLEEHVAHHCKPRTREEYTRAVDQFIKPALG